MSICLCHFLKTFLGSSAQYWPEFGSRYDQLVYYVLRSYYCGRKAPSERTIIGLCSGNVSPSHMLVDFYRGLNGYATAYTDLSNMLSQCVSIIGARQSQMRVYAWLVSQHIPDADRDVLLQHYVETDAELLQVASFIAAVMCYVIACSGAAHP